MVVSSKMLARRKDGFRTLQGGGKTPAESIAMANLAEAIQGLDHHMRTEQQMIRDWVDSTMAHMEPVTIGQYLRPTENHLPVERYWHPDEFKALEDAAYAMGFDAFGLPAEQFAVQTGQRVAGVVENMAGMPMPEKSMSSIRNPTEAFGAPWNCSSSPMPRRSNASCAACSASRWRSRSAASRA